MATDTRDLNGIADLKAALANLGTEVATKVGVAANRKAAKRLMDRLIAVAPEGERQSKASKQYGSIKQNLRVRRVKGRTQGRIKHQISTGDAFWSMFYEFGTVKQPARPWIRPSVEALKDDLAETQITELRAGIERAAKRLAKRSRG